MQILFAKRVLLSGLCSLFAGVLLAEQAPSSRPDETWVGRRIVILKGFGDVHRPPSDRTEKKHMTPEELVANGHNIVAVVKRVEGNHVWVDSTGGGDVGWVAGADAILLDDAIPYFTQRISRNPRDWDSYFRRADAEHALNRRPDAIADYTRAIELRPNDPFLYMRRGRSFRVLKECAKAVGDFEVAMHLKPKWAEPYNMEAGIYADCPDSSVHDLAKAIERIRRAISLDPGHATYLTVLAHCYAQAGEPKKAADAQREAVESPRFPPNYREGAMKQLREYEAQAAAVQESTRQ